MTIKCNDDIIPNRYQKEVKRGDKMYQMILRIPMEMKQDLKVEAKARGQTLTGLIKQILWEWLNKSA